MRSPRGINNKQQNFSWFCATQTARHLRHNYLKLVPHALAGTRAALWCAAQRRIACARRCGSRVAHADIKHGLPRIFSRRARATHVPLAPRVSRGAPRGIVLRVAIMVRAYARFDRAVLASSALPCRASCIARQTADNSRVALLDALRAAYLPLFNALITQTAKTSAKRIIIKRVAHIMLSGKKKSRSISRFIYQL